MKLISMFVVGLVAGLIARFLMPGPDQMGWVWTALLGIAGSFVGGFIGNAMNKKEDKDTIGPAGFLMSILGAVVLLIIYRVLN